VGAALILETLSWFTLAWALLARCCRIQVRYVWLSRKLQPHADLLAGLGIEIIDFQECEEVDYTSNYDPHGWVYQALVATVGEPERRARFKPMFPGVDNLGRKLHAIIGQQAEIEFIVTCRLIHWVETRYPAAARIHVMVPPTAFKRQFLKHCRVPLRNHYPRPLVWLERAYELVDRLFQVPLRRRSRVAPQVANAPSGPDLAAYPVLYFPHQGIAFGQLFQKDHFYSDDPESPLYPSRILHLEQRDRLGSLDAGALARDYERQGLPFLLLSTSPRPRELARDLVSFGLQGLRHGVRMLAADTIYVALAYVRFRKYRRVFSQARSARIALVGYDMVFPKTLAMALEAQGIRTVAIQERFYTTFYRHTCGFIVDTYLCSSDLAARVMPSQWHRVIRQLKPVGFVRGDLLQRAGPSARDLTGARPGQKLVVAFDYGSTQRENDGKTDAAVSWAANRAFLRDLIRLSVEYPELYFVLRSRDGVWCQLESFRDLYETIALLPNFEVNHDYSEWGLSYRLAAAADLVLARHTSIGDECLAAGKPVLFLDYLPNGPRIVAGLFDYLGLPVFTHGYEELKAGVDRFLLTGHVLTESERDRLREEVFGPYHDGQVRARVRLELERMLAPAVNELEGSPA